MKQTSLALLLSAILCCATVYGAQTPTTHVVAHLTHPLSPIAMVSAADGQTLFVACATGNEIVVVDTASNKTLRRFALPGPPSGLTLSRNGDKLHVTCAAPNSGVCTVDVASGHIKATIPCGHTAMSPVLGPDDQTLYVCNRFNNEIAVIDLTRQKVIQHIPVSREPVAAALTPDGRFLFVANLLQAGRADVDVVAAVVSVIDTSAGKVVKELTLPNGSASLRDIRISPDGNIAVVSHILSRFHLPTTQLDRGWMNSNALSLIDVNEQKVINTVLLDNVDRGAANPWGVAWSADSQTVVVAHAGTHEVSVIQMSALMDRLKKLPAVNPAIGTQDVYPSSRSAAEVSNDLSFLVGLRQRIKLTGNGPRTVGVMGRTAYVGLYFSDTIERVSLDQPTAPTLVIQLSDPIAPSKPHSQTDLKRIQLRQGKQYFNDASLCFQGWQSCTSCHTEDARVDALNWDLLNDGIGNPKNSKSLLLSHRTPPAMSMGVRETAETAVRAGIRHILFTEQPEAVAAAIDEWLKSLKPIPSPLHKNGSLSAAAKRGRNIFQRADVGCLACHPSGLFTDQKPHDVGTTGHLDKGNEEFDTPTLIELWRTAPYLHDGSAATVRDLITRHNPKDQHGMTSNLTKEQLNDLVEYLLSL